MENLNITSTGNTPKIELDISGILTFNGKSYPENAFEFYQPVENWLTEYIQINTNKKTLVNFDLNYMNSSSMKFYFDLFESLEEFAQAGNYVEIQWFYHKDDDMTLEAGEEFQEDYENLNIVLKEKA